MVPIADHVSIRNRRIEGVGVAWDVAVDAGRALEVSSMLGGRYRIDKWDAIIVLAPMLHRDPSV
jgi:hypothetical protein